MALIFSSSNVKVSILQSHKCALRWKQSIRLPGVFTLQRGPGSVARAALHVAEVELAAEPIREPLSVTPEPHVSAMLLDSTTLDLSPEPHTVEPLEQQPFVSVAISESTDAAAPWSFLTGGPVQAMILLNLGAALFGSNQVAIKVTEEVMSPSALTAVRFALAALCFAPSMLKGIQNGPLRLAALELGFWLFGGYTAQALGLQYTTAANGAFTGTFTVLVVPLLVGLSGRAVPLSTWLAAMVALFGVGLLTSSGADPNIGDALCILSATLFGVHKWRSETVTAVFKDTTNELISIQLAVLAVASALVTLPDVVGVFRENSPADVLVMVESLPWASLFYMGLATTAFTLWVEMNALKEVSAPLAALIYTAEPLWGALFAWGLLGERWGPQGWVGAGLIVSASLAAQLTGNKDHEKTA